MYILVTITPEYNDEIYSLNSIEDFDIGKTLFSDRATAVAELKKQLKDCFSPRDGYGDRDWSHNLYDFDWDWRSEYPMAAGWEEEVYGEDQGYHKWHQFIDWCELNGKEWVQHVPPLVKLFEVEYNSPLNELSI